MGCLSVQPIIVQASSVKQLRCKSDSLSKARVSVKARAGATGGDAEDKTEEPVASPPSPNSQNGEADVDFSEKVKEENMDE